MTFTVSNSLCGRPQALHSRIRPDNRTSHAMLSYEVQIGTSSLSKNTFSTVLRFFIFIHSKIVPGEEKHSD